MKNDFPKVRRRLAPPSASRAFDKVDERLDVVITPQSQVIDSSQVNAGILYLYGDVTLPHRERVYLAKAENNLTITILGESVTARKGELFLLSFDYNEGITKQVLHRESTSIKYKEITGDYTLQAEDDGTYIIVSQPIKISFPSDVASYGSITQDPSLIDNALYTFTDLFLPLRTPDYNASVPDGNLLRPLDGFSGDTDPTKIIVKGTADESVFFDRSVTIGGYIFNAGTLTSPYLVNCRIAQLDAETFILYHETAHYDPDTGSIVTTAEQAWTRLGNNVTIPSGSGGVSVITPDLNQSQAMQTPDGTLTIMRNLVFLHVKLNVIDSGFNTNETLSGQAPSITGSSIDESFTHFTAKIINISNGVVHIEYFGNEDLRFDSNHVHITSFESSSETIDARAVSEPLQAIDTSKWISGPGSVADGVAGRVAPVAYCNIYDNVSVDVFMDYTIKSHPTYVFKANQG